MAKSCKGCRFWRTISGEAAGIHACHFLLDTGIPRYCPPEECTYYTAKGLKEMSQGKALTPEVIRLIEQMSADGKSASYICKTLGVGATSVYRVRSGQLKSPETVSTPIEPVPEDIKDSGISAATSIPEPAEKVKPEPDIQYRKITDCDGQYRAAPDNGGQTEQPNNSRQLDYEEQREYIADVLKSTLEDIDEEIRSFEERIGMLQASLEERRQKQAYLRDFIKSMR